MFNLSYKIITSFCPKTTDIPQQNRQQTLDKLLILMTAVTTAHDSLGTAKFIKKFGSRTGILKLGLYLRNQNLITTVSLYQLSTIVDDAKKISDLLQIQVEPSDWHPRPLSLSMDLVEAVTKAHENLGAEEFINSFGTKAGILRLARYLKKEKLVAKVNLDHLSSIAKDAEIISELLGVTIDPEQWQPGWTK
jgi:hypothetical protein